MDSVDEESCVVASNVSFSKASTWNKFRDEVHGRSVSVSDSVSARSSRRAQDRRAFLTAEDTRTRHQANNELILERLGRITDSSAALSPTLQREIKFRSLLRVGSSAMHNGNRAHDIRSEFVLRKMMTAEEAMDDLQASRMTHRICSWTVAAFVTVVTGLHPDFLSIIDVLCDSCKQLLLSIPQRKVVFAVAVAESFDSLLFVAARQRSTCEHVELLCTSVLCHHASEELASFLDSSSLQLDFQEQVFFAIESFHPIAALGRGSTCSVVEIEGDWPVLKLSRDTEAFAIEHHFTSRIREQILIDDKPHLLERLPQCQLSLSDTVGIALQRPQFLPQTTRLTKADVMDLWKILREAHRAGIVHRDIREPNVLRTVDNQHSVLIDWCSSANHNIPCESQSSDGARPSYSAFAFRMGGRSTASIRVLKLMDASPLDSSYRCTPCDEVVSLIFLALQSRCSRSLPIHKHPSDWQSAQRQWKGHIKSHIKESAQLWAHLEALQSPQADETITEAKRKEILMCCLQLIY